MESGQWKHVLGNTWCIDAGATIPVWFLNDREVVLLDSGYVFDREEIDRLLSEKNLRVRAIIGSHSHWDHNGSHAYYQQKHGAEVILRDVEAALVSDWALIKAIYPPASEADLRREMPFMLLRADRTFSAGDKSVEVDGHVFGLVPLPGHTPGHTGIVTPDDVLYVGDAILSPTVMADAKLPTTADWAADLESKERLRNERHRAYILAHDGAFEDIGELIEENIADRERRVAQAVSWLRQREAWTMEGVERLLWQKLDLHTKRPLSQFIYLRNLRGLVEYLTAAGYLSRQFKDGNLVYVCK